MAAWFVGQRFRVVRPNDNRNMGLTGRISNIGTYRYGDTLPNGFLYGGEHADCYVRLDGATFDGYRDAPARFDQIEPILPEGAQPSEFSFTELMDNLGVVVA